MLKSLHLFDVAVCVFVNSLKLECEKITNEKGEMHRHYIMVSYTLT